MSRTMPRINAASRAHALERAAECGVDVLVIGLGVTGAGVALDAASRGLSVLAVDAHDLAFGTSRWSSKLVHGGLRYLVRAQLGVAHESAVERDTLLRYTAPHLTRALPILLPLTNALSHSHELVVRQGLRAGDLLRSAAGTPRSLLPPPRRLDAGQVRELAPCVTREALRGGLLFHDGQLEDDARLVVALARTAALYGAHVATRTRVLSASGDCALLRDELTDQTFTVRTKAVINAAGVWAGQVAPGLRLRLSRGTHLVFRRAQLPIDVAVSTPVPGSLNRFVFMLPQPDGLVYVGLTDEQVEGDAIPWVPTASEEEVTFLLETTSRVLEVPLAREDVVGSYAGLRPLLAADGYIHDLPRRHAVLPSDGGVVTIVGGKLTTYRRMAQDAVDTAVELRALPAKRCVTERLPLVGAARREVLAQLSAPARLVRKYGTEAASVLVEASRVTGWSNSRLLAPIADGIPVTRAELVFAVTHEGALDTSDLLDRRTRIGLVSADRAHAIAVAEEVLSAVYAVRPLSEVGEGSTRSAHEVGCSPRR